MSRNLKSAERSTTLTCVGRDLSTSCVVACGRQQNTPSTPSHATSSILQSAGTSVAVIRWGKTSEKAYGVGGGEVGSEGIEEWVGGWVGVEERRKVHVLSLRHTTRQAGRRAGRQAGKPQKAPLFCSMLHALAVPLLYSPCRLPCCLSA